MLLNLQHARHVEGSTQKLTFRFAELIKVRETISDFVIQLFECLPVQTHTVLGEHICCVSS